jgi:hypothetical protein
MRCFAWPRTATPARLISHWRKVLPPGTILDVSYEELVANQEPWTRKILDFLGFDWDERCLQFHTTQRAVVTSSYWQVRQPLYRDSVQRWRKYSAFIDPLRDLEPAGGITSAGVRTVAVCSAE